MDIAQQRIITASLASLKRSVLPQQDMMTYLQNERAKLLFPKNMPLSEILESLIASHLLQKIKCRSPGRPNIVRYALPAANPYEIGLSLRRDSFLSHGTAVVLHSLADRRGRLIFINYEQTPKPAGDELTQDSIDTAFSRPQRRSNSLYTDGKNRFLILNGKFTGKLGVVSVRSPSGQLIQATNLERTLIDIAVRPGYAGGAKQVLEAYKRARNRIDLEVLLHILKELNYKYPYHQALGFYFQRAGFSDTVCNAFKRFGLEFNFYLEHGINNRLYDSQWRIFYPKTFPR